LEILSSDMTLGNVCSEMGWTRIEGSVWLYVLGLYVPVRLVSIESVFE